MTRQAWIWQARDLWQDLLVANIRKTRDAIGEILQEMKLQELKSKKPPELIAYAESMEVENASILRKQELLFAILVFALASNLSATMESIGK